MYHGLGLEKNRLYDLVVILRLLYDKRDVIMQDARTSTQNYCMNGWDRVVIIITDMILLLAYNSLRELGSTGK